ncbi:hypothetical protein POL68_41700 [Stigmatella sp. ncwal1]|uniref:Vegetative protein n=1 Tax=Stigmatella ashevillensis TaxID=2995309 RepID=A0ABT5DQN5_9BACT|nr:hypothetical protein [Stigmatella ashevillena]MDC0715038.1 hypothetical protein [Stigmatella ashevillena]
MSRPSRKNVTTSPHALPPALASWAEAIGDAIGRGMARALHNSGLDSMGGSSTVLGSMRRRGRPPKLVTTGPVPPERRCTVSGCDRESRSKGLCSAHYQAERRRQLAAGKPS